MERISPTNIRKRNYSSVYNLIYQKKRISKQQIATDLQMSLPTVTQHLTDLIREGLIEKTGYISSGIGRKAVAYGPNLLAKISVGVSIAATSVNIVLMDLEGEVLCARRSPLQFSVAEHYWHNLRDAIIELLQQKGFSTEHVLGAGLGIQGLVSNDGAEVIYSKLLDCTGLRIDTLDAMLPFPCRFFHDSECAAGYESWKNPKLDNVIYLSLGQHLGGAIILNGRVQRGEGRTGTFEHMILQRDGKPCYCGNLGCMEAYCSISALLAEDESLDVFFAALRQGDPSCCKRWQEFLYWMAIALNNLRRGLDCPIMLGGYLASYLTQGDLDLLFSLVQSLSAFTEEQNYLLLGRQERDIIASGAAAFFVKRFLDAI